MLSRRRPRWRPVYAAADIAGRTPILICATVRDERGWDDEDDEDDEENAEEGPDADDEGGVPLRRQPPAVRSRQHAVRRSRANHVTVPFYEPKSIVFTKRRSVTDGPSFVPASTQ